MRFPTTHTNPSAKHNVRSSFFFFPQQKKSIFGVVLVVLCFTRRLCPKDHVRRCSFPAHVPQTAAKKDGARVVRWHCKKELRLQTNSRHCFTQCHLLLLTSTVRCMESWSAPRLAPLLLPTPAPLPPGTTAAGAQSAREVARGPMQLSSWNGTRSRSVRQGCCTGSTDPVSPPSGGCSAVLTQLLPIAHCCWFRDANDEEGEDIKSIFEFFSRVCT